MNAIGGGSRFVEMARTHLIPRFEERADPLIGPPTLNFGTIQGGDQPSTVAARCVLTADRRSVPGESFSSICEEFQGLLAMVEAEMPGLESEMRRVPGGMSTMEHVALKTAEDDPVVKAVANARQKVCGAVGKLGAFPAWTDGALLAEFGGIPSVILGPGNLAVAHSPRESVAIEQVTEAARLYAVAALEFCGS